MAEVHEATDRKVAGDVGQLLPVHLTAEQMQIASLIDSRVRALAGAGKDDVTIFSEMADYMPGFKRLMDTARPGEMDNSLCPISGVLPLRQDPRDGGRRDCIR